MKKILKTIVALFTTASIPAVVAGATAKSFSFGIIVFAIASIHLIVLGIPALLLGWVTKKVHLWSTLLVAFFIGATPAAIFLWSWPSYSYAPKNFFENARFVTILGLYGLLGGLAFWLIWQYWIYPDLSNES